MANPLIYSRLRNMSLGEKQSPKHDVARIDEKQEKLMKEILHGRRLEKGRSLGELDQLWRHSQNGCESTPRRRVQHKEEQPKMMTLEELMQEHIK